MQPRQHNEFCLPLNDEDNLLIDDDFDSAGDSDPDSLFDSSDDEVETASNTNSESLLDEVDDNTDNDDDDLFDGELRHPPEYYIAKSNNLDVGRLRQKRYSPKMQDALDWIKEHHEKYVLYGD
jgi:hypothetical protein